MAVELAEPAARPRAPKTWRSIDRRLIAGAIVGAYLLSGIYVVSADQQAVVLRFGAVAETRVPAGVHWTWPYPIARVQTLRVRETKRLMLGLDANEPVKRSQYLTGDRNILNIRLVVQFAINDPVAFLFRATDVNALVGNAARGALAQVVAGRHVDDLLTTEKVAVQERVQVIAQETLTRYQCGVSLLGVVLDSIVPPDEVVEAFRLVASAREDSNRIVREAESYANGVVPVARGEAARLGEQALTYNNQRVNEATGDAARFSSVAAEYAKAPAETGTRLYLEAMDEVLPRMDKTILGADPKAVDLQFLRKK
jgi:membrane protease subunit HflK